MKLSNMSILDILNCNLDKKLNLLFGFFTDSNEVFDAGIVLGGPVSRMEERASAGAELYKQGCVKKLIVSGGVKREICCGITVSEAEHLKTLLVSYGVNEEDVILENEARTTKENMICSVLTLSRYVKNAKNVVIITSPCHLRRSVYLAEYFLPKCYKVYGYTNLTSDKKIVTPKLDDEGVFDVNKEVKLIQDIIIEGFAPDVEL